SNHVLALRIVKPERHATIGAEFLGPGDQFGGQAVALQYCFGTDRMVRRKKTDQPVHVATSLFSTAHRAIFSNTSRDASTSAIVLNHPKLKRTGPVGNVPKVRCADGAQCKPVRAMIPHCSSRIRPTSDGIAPSTLNETTPQ